MIDELYSPGTYILSVGGALSRGDEPPRAVDPRLEYVAVGVAGELPAESRVPELYRRACAPPHSRERHRQMLDTPAVASSFNAIRAGCLSGGCSLLPAIKPVNGKAAPGQVDGDEVEAEMAGQIRASNLRTLESWDTPLPAVLWEGMEALAFGHKLGEPVYREVEGGPDAGLLALKAFKWKPPSSYRFRVDHALNVVGVSGLSWTGIDGRLEWKPFAADDFAWLTWDAEHGDPRGRSMFRVAEHAWRMLMDLWPEIMKGWRQFGTPMMWGTTAENAKMVPVVDASGQPVPGKQPVTAEYAMAMTIQKLRNGDGAAGPFGSAIKVIESAKDSTMVAGALSILQNEIIQGLLLQTRATVEAKHGSRADSQTGQDIMGTLVRFIRMWLERFIRRLLMRQNALNYGEDIARRLTPLVTLGDHEHQDLASFGAIVAQLHQASYFGISQYSSLDTTLGVAQRIPGEPRVGPNGLIYDTNPDPALQPQAGTETTAAQPLAADQGPDESSTVLDVTDGAPVPVKAKAKRKPRPKKTGGAA